MTLLINISNEEYARIMAMDWKNTLGRDEILRAVHDGAKLGIDLPSLSKLQKALDIIDNNHTKLVNYDYTQKELGEAQDLIIDILQQIEEQEVNK